jgi:hypothetical protein
MRQFFLTGRNPDLNEYEWAVIRAENKKSAIENAKISYGWTSIVTHASANQACIFCERRNKA